MQIVRGCRCDRLRRPVWDAAPHGPAPQRSGSRFLIISQDSQRASSSSALRLSLGHLQYLSQMVSASFSAVSSMHSVCSTQPAVTALPHTLQFGISLRLLPLSPGRIRCSFVLVAQMWRDASRIPCFKAIVACSHPVFPSIVERSPIVAAFTGSRLEFLLLFHGSNLLASLCISPDL